MHVALAGLLAYLEKTLDVNRVAGTDVEKKELKSAIQCALQRLKVPQVHGMMTINEFDLECLIGYGSFGNIWKVL